MSVNICFNWTELDFWVFLDDKLGGFLLYV